MKYHSLSKNFAIGVAFLVSISLLFALFIYNSSRVHAAPVTDFNPGNIIDNGVFYNKYAMNVPQIQAFLDTIIPNCDVWGTQPSGYGNLNNAQYAQQIKGWPGPPYVCVNKYYENPDTGETSYEKGGGAFTGGLSSAQIIYNAAQAYSINPRVLLVMLKKESLGPLTADSWPLKNQYKYAMGYACPDSGPDYSANCDTSKAGFYKQMMTAAWQLNYYKEHPNDYRYHLGWNDIQYNKVPSCGTKRVYIENMATLSLYIYTPYTPNDAALAAYPGEVNCGAYGNRNFYAYFKEWFGIMVPPELNDRYVALGGSNGSLGKPIDTNVCSVARDVCYQQFQNGFIIYNATTGAWESRGAIRDYWAAMGYQNGAAGYPTGSETYSPASGTYSQTYQYGTIAGNGTTGYWFVRNNIKDRWNATGGASGSLGAPLASTIGSNGDAYQQFQNGFIVYNAATGAWESKGAIRDYWAKIGYQNGIAGYPTGPELYNATRDTWYQNYQNGTILGKGSSGYWYIRSNIRDYWNNIGGPQSSMGLPLAATVGDNYGGYQQFENGYIIYNPVSGVWESRGAIRDHWAKIGYQHGIAGYPTGPETYDAGTATYSQTYQHGTIKYKNGTGGWFVAS